MAALIAPGIGRYAVQQSTGGRAVVNVLDFFINTTGFTASRAAAVLRQAEVILEQWHTHIRPLQTPSITLQEVSFVDMDSATGSTGSTQTGGAVTWPANGSNASISPVAPNTSVFITKQAPGGGRSTRNGRLFLAGAPELATIDQGQNLDPVSQAQYSTAFQDFHTGCDGVHDATDGDYEASLRIVRTSSSPNPNPPPQFLVAFEGSDDVSLLVADALLATQRRRLRG